MGDHDVQVKFGASIGELIEGVDRVKESIEELAAPIHGMIGAFGEMGEALVAAFAVEKVSEFFEKFAEMGAQTLKFATLLGTSAEQIGALNLAAKGSDTSLEGLAHSMERFGMTLAQAGGGSEKAKAGLEALGIEAKEFQALRPEKQLEELAEKFAVLKDGINKDAIAMAIMGRAGAEMIPLFNRGAEGVREFAEMGERAGSIMSQEVAERFEETHIKSIEMAASFTGLGLVIATDLKPAFDSLTDVTIRSTQSITTWIKETEAAKIVNTALTVTIASLVSAWDVVVATIKGTAEAFAFLTVQVINFLTYISDLLVGISKMTLGWVTFNKEVAKSGQVLLDNSWSKMLDKNKAAAQLSADYMKEVIEDMLSGLHHAWEEPLPEPKVKQQTQTPKLNLEDKNATAAALAEVKERIKLADMEYAETAERLGSEAKIHAITEQQKTQALLAALEVRKAAQLAAIADELAIAKKGSKEYQAILNEKLTLEQKFKADRQKILDQQLQSDVADWNSELSAIQSAWDSQLKGMLGRTTGWGQAMKNIFADLTIKAIEGIESMAIKWAAMELAKTGVTTAQVAARNAAEAAGATVSSLAQIGNAAAVIVADSAKTFAGVFGFLAPVMGPAAAGPAAASGATVLSMLGSIPAAATGGLVLTSGLAVVHSDEQIVPARLNQPYQPGNGGGSPNISVNFTHNGSLSYADIQAHARVIAQAVGQQFSANPSYS